MFEVQGHPQSNPFVLAIGESILNGASGALLFVDSNGLFAQNAPNLSWNNTTHKLSLDGANEGFITSPGTEMLLEVTGGSGGTRKLRLQSGETVHGLYLDNTAGSVDLWDLIYQGASGIGNTAWIRWEARGAAFQMPDLLPEIQIGGGNAAGGIWINRDRCFMQARTSGLVPITVRGRASQTAHLQDWTDSSDTVLAFVAANGDITVPDEAYGSGWNGSVEVPTKNAVYDQVELKANLAAPSFTSLVTITQGSPGSEVLRLQTTATNDDPAEKTWQNRVTTTDATQTTIHTFTVPTSNTYGITATIVARRTGGTAGTEEDGGMFRKTAVFQNAAGTVAQIGELEGLGASSTGTLAFDFTVTGATVLARVTGDVDTNIVWHMTAKTWQVGT